MNVPTNVQFVQPQPVTSLEPPAPGTYSTLWHVGPCCEHCCAATGDLRGTNESEVYGCCCLALDEKRRRTAEQRERELFDRVSVVLRKIALGERHNYYLSAATLNGWAQAITDAVSDAVN